MPIKLATTRAVSSLRVLQQTLLIYKKAIDNKSACSCRNFENLRPTFTLFDIQHTSENETEAFKAKMFYKKVMIFSYIISPLLFT